MVFVLWGLLLSQQQDCTGVDLSRAVDANLKGRVIGGRRLCVVLCVTLLACHLSSRHLFVGELLF
jgi:hypothetical protein